MILKKITSGIAALAMAFGSFAGLGITASAAELTGTLSLSGSNGVYTASFAAASPSAAGDYAMASNDYVTVTASLGSGDSITSSGIVWSSYGIHDSNAKTLNSTKRYLLVEPSANGTLTITRNTSGRRMRYGVFSELTDVTAIGKTDAGTGNTAVSTNNTLAVSKTTDSITCTAGYKYVIYLYYDGGDTITGISFTRTGAANVGGISLSHSNGVSSVSFDSDVSALVKGDYATASNAYVTVTASLGSGDSISNTNSRINWTNRSFDEDDTLIISSTMRYILVEPEYDGTIAITGSTGGYFRYATLADNADASSLVKNDFSAGSTSEYQSGRTIDATAGTRYVIGTYRWHATDTATITGITFTPVIPYDVTFTETNGVTATISINGSTISTGDTISLPNGTYSYTATADGYADYTGSITVENDDLAETFTMEKAPVTSITARYVCSGVEVATKAVTVPEGALYGDSYTYVSTNYILGTNGKYYYVAADETTSATYSGNGSGHYALRKTVTLTADTVIEYDVTEIADEVVYYAEGEDISGLSPSNYHEGRYLASGDKVGAGNYAQTYTVERTGTYKITVALIANDGAYNTGLFRTAAYASAASASNSDGSVLAMNPSNNWYGYVFISDAVDLTAGEVLTLKGFRGNGNLTPVDYMIVKDVTTGKVAATVNVAYSDGSAVSDATVTIGGYVATETETPGTYTADVPVGTHDVTVSKPGYSATGSDSIEVSDGGANTANVTMVRTMYTIVTNPYAGISIDGAAAVSSGSTGSLTVTSGDADEHTIVITKGGYETVSTTVTPSHNQTLELPLTASAGISYKEDFAYVDDNFGFASGATVANGVLSLSVTDGNNSSTTIPSTGARGKLIHLVTTPRNATTNHYGYLRLEGTSLSLYYYGSQIRLHGTNNGKTDLVSISSDTAVDILVSSSNTAASLYVNGKYVGWTSYSGNTLTGLSTSWGKGTFQALIDEISVIDYPGAANVKIGDASAVTYLKGTTITLPESSTGYWTDGTSEYASGASYTVNNNVVFEEAYVITSSNCISAPSSTYTGTDVNFSLAEGCINLGNLKVTKTDDPSTELLVTDNGNGIYTFTMPAYPVTISADADCYVSHDENTVATDGYYAEGASITFSIADGREISVSPVVARTGDLKTTVSVTDNGDGTYTFSMPDHPVTIYAFAYTTPVEIERYNTDPVHHWYDTDTRTTGDGYYARGFTFSAFSGGRAMTSIAVTIDASKQADNEGNITNIGERITGASAVNSGKTSTVSGMNITGEAVFGIMIWTNDTEKVEAIKTFSPSGITIEIE